jgi:sulfofructose kinase
VTGRLDVLCVGSANYDTIADVDHLPADDERITVDCFRVGGGGPAATAAVTLARLGARAGFCGVVGDDPQGAAVRQSLASEGVDTTWLRTDPQAQTAAAFVLTARHSHTRVIITTIAPQPAVEDIPLDVAGWLHVDQTGYPAVRRALAGRSGGPRLSVDGGNAIDGLELDGVDLYAPTLTALLARYPGHDRDQAFAAARAEGARQVVATDGPAGTWVATADGVARVPFVEVDVASTLGAGDVFHGAVLAALIHEVPLMSAVRAANAAAALSCRQVDGRSGIPDLAELQNFLASRRR